MKKHLKKIKKAMSSFFTYILAWLIPPIYRFYMLLVLVTSKTTYINLENLWDKLKRGENVIVGIWHQDALIAPFIFRRRKIVTMVSNNRMGDIADKVLQRCNFITARGGTSYSRHGKSRGGNEALNAINEYFKSHTGVLSGITVDGSRGPNRVVKPGIIFLGKSTGGSICALRSWSKWYLLLPTWDRTMVPLPFNHLIFITSQFMLVPSDASQKDLEDYCMKLQNTLESLAEFSTLFFQKKKEAIMNIEALLSQPNN